MADNPIHVVKLGGSLLDLPGLGARLRSFCDARVAHRLLLLVGGGRAADLVRAFDATHGLGPADGHWLAVRAMQLNSHLVSALLPACGLVHDAAGCRAAWRGGVPALLDPLAWLTCEQAAGVPVPHRWTFTSDAIAAHLARRLGADLLTLLKSTLPAGPCTVAAAAAEGLVDADFAETARGVPVIEVVDLRAEPPAAITLKG